MVLNRDIFIERANKVHNNKYNYSKSIFKGVSKKINILCPEHGEFLQTASSHIKGKGCYKCYGNPLSNILIFINKANSIHNYKYEYNKSIYKNCKNKIIITCRKHGDFEQKPYCHLQGQGCPKCTKNISKMETQWLDFLKIPEKFRNKTIKIGKSWYKVDALDVDKKIVYEFYGDFWHGNPQIYDHQQINKVSKITFKEMYEKTLKKESILIDNGYTVISIWEKDFKIQQKKFLIDNK